MIMKLIRRLYNIYNAQKLIRTTLSVYVQRLVNCWIIDKTDNDTMCFQFEFHWSLFVYVSLLPNFEGRKVPYLTSDKYMGEILTIGCFPPDVLWLFHVVMEKLINLIEFVCIQNHEKRIHFFIFIQNIWWSI